MAQRFKFPKAEAGKLEASDPALNVPGVLALVVISAALSSFAAPAYAGQAAIDTTMPLAWYDTATPSLLLQGETAAQSITIPVPGNQVVVGGLLHVSGTQSTALLNDSRLILRLNGQVLGQITLGGGSDTFAGNFNVPAGFLRSGYNQMQIQAAQDETIGCERYLAGQLWSQVDLQASSLTLQTAPQKLLPELSQLDTVFDRHTAAHDITVTLLYDQSVLVDHPALLSTLVANIAKRYVYVPLQLVAKPMTPEAVERAATGSGVTIIVGRGAADAPLLSLVTNDAGGAVLTVSGADLSSLQTAVNATKPAALLPVAAQLLAPNLSGAPNLDPASPQAVLSSIARPVVKGKLVDNTTLEGSAPATLSTAIWNPDWNAQMLLHLHLLYGVGYASGSSLNVMVNGIVAGTVPFNNPLGGVYGNYKIDVPENLLKPGENIVSFAPNFSPVSDGDSTICTPHNNSGGPHTTIFDDSRFTFKNGTPAYISDLAALRDGGFQARQIAVPTADPDLLSAALTMVAKFAQQPNIAVPQLVVGASTLDKNGAITLTPHSTATGSADAVTMRMYDGAQGDRIDIAGPVGALDAGVDQLVQWSGWPALSGAELVIQNGAIVTAPPQITPKHIISKVGDAADRNPVMALIVAFAALISAGILIRFGTKAILKAKHNGVRTRDGELS
jgi:cellulose synthase operon protein B